MRLFLQIDIGDWKQRNYHNPLVPFASSLAPDLMCTDFDNESESTVIDLVIKLAEQAEFIFVFIAANSEAPVGSVVKMIRYLLQNDGKVQNLIMLGEHSAIEQHAQNFEQRFIKAGNIEEVKKLVRDFAEKIV